MATSAFKSTTRRSSIVGSATSPNDSTSTNRSWIPRRSRSLNRFSRLIPSSPSTDDYDDVPAQRGRFVNTVRGSGFPEISLDDLAIEFFGSGDRDRSASRNVDPSPGSGSSTSLRRGRSVSRHSSRPPSDGSGTVGNVSSCGRVVPDNNQRRRRSVSVVRYQISDSESDLDHSQSSGGGANKKSFGSRNNQSELSRKLTASNHRPTLRRSPSQKDLKPLDGYSSQSSVITDDEGKDASFNSTKIGKTIEAIYAQKAAHHTGNDVNGGLYDVMRKELRLAVEEIREELEQEMVKRKSSVSASSKNSYSKGSDVHPDISPIRRNYSTVLEQVEKRKQGSLSKMVLPEQRGHKVVKDLPPDPVNTDIEKPFRARKRSNDRNRLSKRLTEEAEKYIEDFICNLEDTDISSLDGERSDTSSSIGGIPKNETFQRPVASSSIVEMDGVVLPWLQWETNNDATPLPCKTRTESPITPKTIMWDVTREMSSTQGRSHNTASSRGSWNPGVDSGISKNVGEDIESRFGGPGIFRSKSYSDDSRGSRIDMEEYIMLQSNDVSLLERWRQRHRLSSDRATFLKTPSRLACWFLSIWLGPV